MGQWRHGFSDRRCSFRIILTLLLLVTCSFFCVLNSFALAADDQLSKAVRRSSSESVSSKDQRRVALVIGNGDYKDIPLRNPAHDAEDMAKSLRALGFSVLTRINANQRQIEDSVKEFVREIQNGDVGLFYFSGHGVQVHGENYLMPIGAAITSEADIKYKAVNAGHILAQMDESRNRTNIFILDACRNNPFKGFRSLSRGLTMMDAPAGTFIAYATAPGSVAADGTDRNSPYAKHLIQALTSKGMKIEDVFKQVLREVRKETQGQQVPWTASSLQDDFYFNPSSPGPVQDASLPHSTWSGPASIPSADYRERIERLDALVAAQGNTSADEEVRRTLKDPKVVKWIRQAAERGDAVSQFWLARMFDYEPSAPGISWDKGEAAKWYKQAADQGNSNAQFYLGQRYQEAENYEEAVKWIRKAAEQGNLMAQAKLGHMYMYGGWTGVARDYQEAVKWYVKVAEKGDAEAQNNLGYIYQMGDRRVPEDLREAAAWYKKAADQGHADAQQSLGWMYESGIGVPQSYSEALKWYRKAADQRNGIALSNIGALYQNGHGVPKDPAEAIKWYKLAADQGNEFAKKALKELGAAEK